MKCEYCRGEGSYWTTVEWSDGLGQAREICPLCDGTGSLAQRAEEIAVDAKRRAAEATNELRMLRTYLVLLQACQAMDADGVTDPNERSRRLQALNMLHAPNPAVWTQVWAEYVEGHKNEAPRRAVVQNA